MTTDSILFYEIIQFTIVTVENCSAIHTLDLLLLNVKCPFDKTKILWATIDLEESF